MSAFVMDKDSLSSMAAKISGFIKNRDYNHHQLVDTFGPEGNYETIFRELYRVNEKSVNDRYGEENETWKMVSPDEHPVDITKPQLLKFIHCWEYQSCEFEDYESDPIWKAIYGLDYALMKSMVRDMPAYNNAHWR